MAINSKQKGNAGEREFAKFLREQLGIGAIRGQQYNGLEGEDVRSDIKDLHIEVKRVERLNITEAMEQSERDAKDKVPMVAHRKNRKPWLITIMAKDLRRFCKMVMDCHAQELVSEYPDYGIKILDETLDEVKEMSQEEYDVLHDEAQDKFSQLENK